MVFVNYLYSITCHNRHSDELYEILKLEHIDCYNRYDTSEYLILYCSSTEDKFKHLLSALDSSSTNYYVKFGVLRSPYRKINNPYNGNIIFSLRKEKKHE